jgi:hypothetical protein
MTTIVIIKRVKIKIINLIIIDKTINKGGINHHIINAPLIVAAKNNNLIGKIIIPSSDKLFIFLTPRGFTNNI